MIASQLTPKWIFFRCTLSENLGRAPLCLRFLPRSTKKSPIWAKCALHHWFPILPRVTLNINQAAKYNGRNCFVASLLAMTTSQPSSSQAICRTSRPPYLSLRAQRGNLLKICSTPYTPVKKPQPSVVPSGHSRDSCSIPLPLFSLLPLDLPLFLCVPFLSRKPHSYPHFTPSTPVKKPFSATLIRTLRFSGSLVQSPRS